MDVTKQKEICKTKYSTRIANNDRRHINMAYVQMHDALNELQMVYGKDNILAHMVRQLGAMEDTLYEYVTVRRNK